MPACLPFSPRAHSCPQELKAALPPSVKAGADTAAALIQQAKPATEGKLTRKEYHDALDK
jgi:hypothetical protein